MLCKMYFLGIISIYNNTHWTDHAYLDVDVCSFWWLKWFWPQLVHSGMALFQECCEIAAG